MNTKKAFDSAVLAHSIRTTNAVETFVTRDGSEERIRGRVVSVVQIGIRTVALLSKESTPQNVVAAEDAETNFRDAIKALLDKGESFYTELHPGWALPALHWTRA